MVSMDVLKPEKRHTSIYELLHNLPLTVALLTELLFKGHTGCNTVHTVGALQI